MKHALVVGAQHNYSQFGSLVAGFRNNILGDFSSVSGGYRNTADGEICSVSGGECRSVLGLDDW